MIIAISAVLMLAGACGQQVGAGSSEEAGSAGNNVAHDHVDSAPVPGSKELSRSAAPGEAEGAPVPRDQIDATALPEGHPVEVTVSGDGRTLTIVGQEGGCSRASAELAEQNAARVVVRMADTKPTDKNVACTMDMRYPPLTVELDAPLGERRLVLNHITARAIPATPGSAG